MLLFGQDLSFSQNKELVFVSSKKGFKDISPVTISFWIKQIVILCYELSDQESITLHQVKSHDVRTFAASKAFQLGDSLEQILSACHWKSHKSFIQFYLKAWADSEVYLLGPVVADELSRSTNSPNNERFVHMKIFCTYKKQKSEKAPKITVPPSEGGYFFPLWD